MLGIFKGLKPDITPAQVIGLLIGGIPVAAKLGQAFGIYDLSSAEQAALTDALTWAAVVAGALFVSDAGLRAARNGAAAQRDSAALLATPRSTDTALHAKVDVLIKTVGALAGGVPLERVDPPAAPNEPPDQTPVEVAATPVEAASAPLEPIDTEGLVDDRTEFDSPPSPLGAPADPDAAR